VAEPAKRALCHPAAALPLLVLLGPYYLNKLIYIAHPGDYPVFLAADYANKLVTLGLLWLVARDTTVDWPIPWRLDRGGPKDWACVIAGSLLLMVLDALTASSKTWLNDMTGRLTRYPAPDGHPLLEIVDDTAGCLLTGLAEEAIFRFYLINALRLRGLSMPAAIVVSTILFAAIHWSYGGGNVAYAGIAGLTLALIFAATRNLLAPVLVHGLVDIYFFTGTDERLLQLVR
jgi:membrane protease YdiL (CAAX protease family)